MECAGEVEVVRGGLDMYTTKLTKFHRSKSLAVLLTAMLHSAPAHASLYCELIATRDGYAAVRAEPDRQSRMVMRVALDQLVALDPVKQPPARARDWVAVYVESGNPKRIVARGWLHKSLLKPDSCG